MHKINIKYFFLLIIFINLSGCETSTRSKIAGIWDAYYSNEDGSASYTITFSEGKNKWFTSKGDMVFGNGRINCKFSTIGSFRISENNILSLKYNDVSVYGCNSNFMENKIRDYIAKMKHQNYSHKILSIDSEVMITEEMDKDGTITYIRNRTLEREQERKERERKKEILKSDKEKNNHSMYGKQRDL